ncbi:alpha/beta-hydrolase [Auricularia subglabra TFB-10046 SS5]|nr:alpha/beta-hydrolase [Auricularia subglabra TFB-10046 SS5]
MPAAATRSPPPRLARQKSTPVTSSMAPTPSARPPSPRVPYFDRYPQRGASDNRSARSAGGSVRSLPNRSPGRMSDAPVAFPTVADPVLPRDDPLVLRAARQRANSSPRTHSPTSTIASPPPRFSASSSLTQATATTYSPPRTPPHERSDSFMSHVSVIAPISGVDVMDALVDVMNADFGSKNGRDDFFPNHHPKPSASSTSSSRRSKASKWDSHHPLYHPPLPEPPPGVKLGGRLAPSSSSSKCSRPVEKAKSNGRSTARRSESDPDEDSGGTQRPRGPSAPPVSRIPVYSSHPPRRASLNKGSSPAATPSRTPSTSQPPPGPPSRSASRSASKSSLQSRPTPAQAIAAASRASSKSHPSHASSPAGTSAKSKPSHPSQSGPPIHVQIPSEPSSPDEPSTNGERARSSRDARDVHPGALATACTDAESPAALVPSSSGSSPYATASSSPQNDSLALEDMPSLPIVAGSVRIVQGRNNPSSPPTSPPKAQIVPSITDIIKAHAPEIAASRERDRAAVQRSYTSPESRARSGTQRTATSSRASSGSGYGIVLQDKTARWRTEEEEFGYGYGASGGARRSSSTRDSHSQSHASHRAYRYVDHLDEIGSTRSSMDSVAQEVELTLHLNAPSSRTRSNISSPPTSANTVKAFPSSNANSNGLGSSTTRVLIPEAHDERPRRPSTSAQSPGVPFPAALTGASPRLVGASKDKNKDTAMALASYLRSPRLTRLLTLKRKPHSTSIPGATTLQVSLSDVGKETGRPVVVFLGLGCVRYLTALYDEMATALNLRLICIDRWGLGRTSEPIATSSRGVLEWAGVVEEVLDLLDIGHVSVMAHSAGAPYAMAFAQRVGNRVQGDICLLAPWVGGTEAAGYKWLKYVPNALVKTAQAAEWKMQGWKLGKPPTLAYDGIGFDAAADDYLDETRRPSFATSVFSEYDDLADFQGKFDSGSTLCIDQQQQMLIQQTQQQQQQPRGAKRKISKGFLGLWKGGSSTSSNTPSPPTPQRSASASQPTAPSTPRLKGLKSMGSLKSGYRAGARTRTTSTVTTATTATSATSPILPQVPTLNVGLGLDWSELRASAGPSTAPAGDGRGGSPKSSWSPITPVDSRVSSIKGDKDKETSLEVSFASALLAASHAESARGLNADLNTILNHDHKPWGFSYASFSHGVKVWHGDRDERIGEAAVRWMEKMMKVCEVKIVKGAGHSLMTNAKVVVEALESISDAWDRD